MARRAFAPRKSLRDTKLANNAWDRYYALSAGMEPMAQSEIKPKRAVVNHSDPNELEGAVLKEVGEIIRLSPNVVMAWRQNGGAAQAADGVFRIWFYRWVKRPVKEMTLPDFICVLKTGKLAVLECKRRDWKFTGTERERAQREFIMEVIALGGRGGFVSSAEDALKILA